MASPGTRRGAADLGLEAQGRRDAVPHRHRARRARGPDQAEIAHAVACAARGRDRRNVRHQSGHPARTARRGVLQGRRRCQVDCQCCAPISDRAERDGGALRADLCGPPAFDRRWADRRGDHPRARPGRARGQGGQPHRDGEARDRRRRASDPGDHRSDGLHPEPRGAARCRGRGRRTNRGCRARPGGGGEGAEGGAREGAVRAGDFDPAGADRGGGPAGAGARVTGRAAGRGEGFARRHLRTDGGRGEAGSPYGGTAGSSPKFAARPTPRPTASGRSPRPHATRRS